LDREGGKDKKEKLQRSTWTLWGGIDIDNHDDFISYIYILTIYGTI
jgi:hypothetical protein